MSVTIAPATLFDLAELGGAHSRVQWGDALELFRTGQFFAFRAGTELIALGGFNPLGEGTAQMFFNAAPAAARHMPGILARGRLTIKAAPYRAIVTICRSDAGRLFARRLGFSFRTVTQFGEVWAYGPADGGDGQQDAAAAAEPDPVGAAHEPGDDGGAAGAARPGGRG